MLQQHLYTEPIIIKNTRYYIHKWAEQLAGGLGRFLESRNCYILASCNTGTHALA